MVKFFSSEVADLEPVLALLLRCDAEVSPLTSALRLFILAMPYLLPNSPV